jgi:predicted transcriptional regulator
LTIGVFEEKEPIWTGSALELMGREVRKSRHRLEMTQRELGRLVWLSQSTISRVEHGRNRTLKLAKFARLVVALGWVGDAQPRAIVLDDAEPMPPPAWFIRR